MNCPPPPNLRRQRQIRDDELAASFDRNNVRKFFFSQCFELLIGGKAFIGDHASLSCDHDADIVDKELDLFLSEFSWHQVSVAVDAGKACRINFPCFFPYVHEFGQAFNAQHRLSLYYEALSGRANFLEIIVKKALVSVCQRPVLQPTIDCLQIFELFALQGIALYIAHRSCHLSL